MFDQVNHEEAESNAAVVMDTFLLGAIVFVLVAFVVYVAASLRLGRSRRAPDKPDK
jgi:hypothetical protein